MVRGESKRSDVLDNETCGGKEAGVGPGGTESGVESILGRVGRGRPLEKDTLSKDLKGVKEAPTSVTWGRAL